MVAAFTVHAWASGILSFIGTVFLLPCSFTTFWIITEQQTIGLFKTCTIETKECGPASDSTSFNVLRAFAITAMVLCIVGFIAFAAGCRMKHRGFLFFGGWSIFIGGLFIFLACTFVSIPFFISNYTTFRYYGWSYVLGWLSSLFTLWGSLWNCVAASAVDQLVVTMLV